MWWVKGVLIREVHDPVADAAQGETLLAIAKERCRYDLQVEEQRGGKGIKHGHGELPEGVAVPTKVALPLWHSNSSQVPAVAVPMDLVDKLDQEEQPVEVDQCTRE